MNRDLRSAFSHSPDEQARRLELLYRVGLTLSSERKRERLVETILLESKKLCQADGGTLYLRTDDDHLRFAIMHSDTLKIAKGGSTGESIDLPPIPMFDGQAGKPNLHNIASYAATEKRSVNIPDAYDDPSFDFSGTKAFDRSHGYRSTSFLTIPLLNGEGEVIGVLQLINAHDEKGAIVPFSVADQHFVEALAAQAGLALDNQLLLDGQKELLESFIKLIASAIDAKSPYTGGHCERVPRLTRMLTEAACVSTNGYLRDFELDEDQWYELEIAAWLHDCGKVTTPVHVMDKATKLETIYDRIELVMLRFEVIERDLRLEHLESIEGRGGDLSSQEQRALKEALEARLTELQDDRAFIRRVNKGGEWLSEDDKARIIAISERRYLVQGESRPLLSEDERKNLCISRGTLTEEERRVINGHMVQTIKMLEALPFPRQLRRVPEYAGGHHERMNGQGYPRGLYAGDMSIPARIMAIADVFEALTAQDRPYKPGKSLSESMAIMGEMKRHNHLDPVLFDLFVESGVYRRYAEPYLSPEQLDEVDESALLAIQPTQFELPKPSVRDRRWDGFLPEYEDASPDISPRIGGPRSH